MDDDETLHIEESRIMLCEIGFACFVTVMGRGLRDIGALFAWTGHSTLDVVIVANVVHVVALCAIALVCACRGVTMLGLKTNVASSLLFITGYLMAWFLNSAAFTSFPLVVLCQSCFGCAGALGMVGWVCTFFCEGRRAAVEVLSASFFGCILGFALGAADDVSVVCLFCVLICVMSSVCAAGLHSSRLRLNACDTITRASVVTASQFGHIVSTVWVPALCIGALGFMSAVARGMLGEQDAAFMLSVTMASEAVSCFALITLFTWKSLRIEVVSLYKVLFPIGALAFLALTFLGGVFVAFLAAVAEFSFSLCSVLMTLQAIEFCQKLNSPPTVVTGVFSGLNHGVLTLGYLMLPLSARGSNEQFYSVVAVVVIFVLAMVLFFATRRVSVPRREAESALDLIAQPVAASPFIPVLPDSLSSIDLSRRESEVLGLILQGRDVPAMADVLGLSKNTVRTHVKSLYAKFDVHSRQELIRLFHTE